MAATRNEQTPKSEAGQSVRRRDLSVLTTGVLQGSSRSEKAPVREPGVVPVKRASIRPRMQVYDKNGMHLGQVKEVREVDFSVDRAWRADIRLPIQRVLAVMDQDVFLTAA